MSPQSSSSKEEWSKGPGKLNLLKNNIEKEITERNVTYWMQLFEANKLSNDIIGVQKSFRQLIVSILLFAALSLGKSNLRGAFYSRPKVEYINYASISNID